MKSTIKGLNCEFIFRTEKEIFEALLIHCNTSKKQLGEYLKEKNK